MASHPHHAKVTPKFCKQYASVGQVIQGALQAYREEVSAGAFPSERYSPYRMAPAECEVLAAKLRAEGEAAVADVLEEEAARAEKAAMAAAKIG